MRKYVLRPVLTLVPVIWVAKVMKLKQAKRRARRKRASLFISENEVCLLDNSLRHIDELLNHIALGYKKPTGRTVRFVRHKELQGREDVKVQEYEKIETIYARDVDGTKKLMPGVFRNLTVEFLQNVLWSWTEKVDGTNIRIHWDGHKVEFGGRTDKAMIPVHLHKYLDAQFSGAEFEEMLEQTFGEKDVIFFGEGYGAKIQNGGDYTEDGKSVGFVLFDVMINGNYQERENVNGIARILGMDTVPLVGVGTLKEAVEYVKNRPLSKLGNKTKFMEGVVCRPLFELRDRTGKRIIVKIKWEDFKDVG